MQYVELLDQKLYAGLDKLVGDVIAVYLSNGGHDEEVSGRVEDILELLGSVDDSSHAIA